MNIQEFFEQSAGQWFSQRTSHYIACKQSENSKLNFIIELLPADAPEVVKLCEQHNIEPQNAICGVRVTWDGTREWDKDKEKHQGSTVLVPIPDLDKPSEGRLLREMGYAEKIPVAGRYIMGDDDTLTLITEYETMYSEERLSFASPNLRLRTSILKRVDEFSMASFSSEIRMGVTQTQKKAEDTAASV